MGLLTKLFSLQASSTLSQNMPESQVTQPPKGQEFSLLRFLLHSLTVGLFLNADYFKCVDCFGIEVILTPRVHSCFPAGIYCSNGEECG